MPPLRALFGASCYNVQDMILVTGGTGFVGNELTQQLAAMGRPVRTLLRPSASSPNLPKGVPVEVVICSLKDQRGLRAALKDVETVFHLAGTERLGSRADLTGVDIEGTEALAFAAAEAGVERIFYLSHLSSDRFSAYALLKAKAIAEGHIIRSGIPYTIFRSAAIYGPRDQFTTSIARLLQASPGIFLLPGEGDALLQPIWIGDVVTCMLLALEDPQMQNRVLEIGGGEYFTFRQVVELLADRLKVRRTLVPFNAALLRALALFLEQSGRFPVSIFWLDTLAAARTCPLDTLPRVFGLMPARFGQNLDHLQPRALKLRRSFQ